MYAAHMHWRGNSLIWQFKSSGCDAQKRNRETLVIGFPIWLTCWCRGCCCHIGCSDRVKWTTGQEESQIKLPRWRVGLIVLVDWRRLRVMWDSWSVINRLLWRLLLRLRGKKPLWTGDNESRKSKGVPQPRTEWNKIKSQKRRRKLYGLQQMPRNSFSILNLLRLCLLTFFLPLQLSSTLITDLAHL